MIRVDSELESGAGSAGPFATRLDRRAFIKACVAAGATLGLDPSVVAGVARAVASGKRPPVVWLHLQECTGCTETLLRTTAPSIQELLFELISLDYHETLCAAAGHQLEVLLEEVLASSAGEYLCVIEGAVPLAEDGIFCKVGGRTALDLVTEVGGKAAAVIAIGSCASFGGIPASPPNPTGATGVAAVLKDKPVVNLPGCPPNPYNLFGTLLQFLTYGRLPALDELGRPLFAYGRTIHEHCPRRPHFDAGHFAEAFGDVGHRKGWCLYELGCKGPQTHANCTTQHFCEIDGAWPIGIGHPCVGCTEAALAFRVPLHDTIEVPEPTPMAAVGPMQTPFDERAHISPLATGLAGLVGGVLAGAAFMLSRRMNDVSAEEVTA